MFLEKDELQHVTRLLRKEESPDAILLGLKDFFIPEYGIEPLAYFCDTLTDGRKRLRYVVWNREEQESFFTHTDSFYGRDLDREQKIKEQFSAICRREGAQLLFQDPDAYFAVPTEVRSDLRTQIQHMTEPKIKAYLTTITEVKKVEFFFDTVHIFYESDADVAANRNGLSERIERQIRNIKKRADEFGACENGGTVFSSLQTLREKFDDNLYYYFH